MPLPSCGSLFGNRVVWTEDAGGGGSVVQWFMLQEIMCSSSGKGGPWQIFLYKSSNGMQWLLQNDGAPLRSLQLHPDGMCDNPPSSSSCFITGTMTCCCVAAMTSLIQVWRS